MAKAKLTNSSDEADLSSVFGNNAIFSIPFFQRPYKWQPKQVHQLTSDVLSLVDGRSDVHFLGAIIIHGLPNNPADAKVFEVIDGQQRLTTLFLFICAVVRTLIDQGETDEAEALFRGYLVTSIPTKGKSNLKLHPCREDQGDLNKVVHELLDLKGFGTHLAGFSFVPLPGSSDTTGRIAKNFLLLKKFVREQFREGGIDRVRQINKDLLQRMSIVQIDVQDPTNGPKIFDALNSRQEPMTVGDLVRNEVFAKVAVVDPEMATTVESHEWEPFYSRFKNDKRNYFDDYFFPFGLIRDSNLRKSDVYASLRTAWKDSSPSEVIKELALYQDAFLDIVTGTNHSKLGKTLVLRLSRLRLLGLPSSTYPFLMQLVSSVQVEALSTEIAAEMLDLLDTFLTRRALCGHEPTGLHAVFKKLWGDLGDDLTAEKMATKIAMHKTVAWPSTEELRSSVKSRPLYDTSADDYFVQQYDQSLGGDTTSDVPWIEHVLPSTHSDDWDQFSAADHTRFKDVAANLIPLSSSMNSSLGNKAYALKRAIYEADSMFKSAREFGIQYSKWTPADLEARGELLANWAAKRWPHERPEIS